MRRGRRTRRLDEFDERVRARVPVRRRPPAGGGRGLAGRAGQPVRACKFFDERLAEAYHDEHGLDVVGLRPPGIYGPFKSVPEPHNELVERAARGESTTVPYGDQRVELVYVRDVARALRRACEAGSPSRLVYNLGADYVTYREAARAATEVLDGEVTATDEETMSWTHDVDWSAARDDLGYEPRYAFREGIAEHAELLEAAGD